VTNHPPKREEEKGGFFDYGPEIDEREEGDIDEL